MARRVVQDIKFDGGVNLLEKPRSIADNELVRAKNLYLDSNGELTKRPGLVGIAPYAIGDQVWTSVGLSHDVVPRTVMAIANVDKQTGARFAYCGYNAEDLATNHNGQPTGWGIGAGDGLDTQFITLMSGLVPFPRGARPCFFSADGETYAVWEGFEGVIRIRRKVRGRFTYGDASFEVDRFSFTPQHAANAAPLVVDGSLVAMTQSVPVTPRVACRYQGRTVYANFGVGREHWLVFSDFSAEPLSTAWAITAPTDGDLFLDSYPYCMLVGSNALQDRYFALPDATEPIVGLTEISLGATGTAVQTALLVLTTKSAWICTGAPSFTSDTVLDATSYQRDFQMQRVNYEVGCASQETIVRTPYGTMWASYNDVWLLSGNLPMRVGTKIRPALQACPRELNYMWSAAYHEGKFMLDVRTGVGGTTGSFVENTARMEQWWLNMRGGPPQGSQDAQWYGPQDYSAVSGGVPAGPADVADPTGIFGFPIISNLLTDPLDTGGIGVFAAVQALNAGGETGAAIASFTQASARPIDHVQRPLTEPLLWTALTDYAPGDSVRPTVPNGHVYELASAGTSGATEPTWTTGAVSGPIIDGTIGWFEGYIGSSAAPQFNGVAPRDAGNPSTSRGTYAVTAELLTKEFPIGDPNLRKMLGGVEIRAGMGRRQLLDTTVIGDHGASSTAMDQLTLGGQIKPTPENTDNVGFTLGVSQLDLDVTDEAAYGALLSEPMESRVVGPDESSRVRASYFQVKVADRAGFIIDETNDYICWGFTGNNFSSPAVLAATACQIPHGEYANIAALLVEVVAALNASTADVIAAANIEVDGAAVWSATSPHVAAHPYFTQLTFTFDDADAEVSMVLLFGAVAWPVRLTPDGTSLSVDTRQGLASTRLLGMLGYDTNRKFTDATQGEVTGYAIPIDIWAGPSADWHAESHISQVNPSPLSITNLRLYAREQSGRPLADITRR